MTKALSRMNRTELVDELASHGYDASDDQTVPALRDVLSDIRAQDEATESPESDDVPDNGSEHAFDGSGTVSDEYVRVTARPQDRNCCILWERHALHPGGEVFVSSSATEPVLVGRTARVESLLQTGLLVEEPS